MDEDDDQFIQEYIIDPFTRLGGNGTLKSIELYLTNTVKVIADITANPYYKIYLTAETQIPQNGRLKLHVEIRESETERDVTIIAAIPVKNCTLMHVTDIEIPYFDTLSDEADNKKIVDPTKLSSTRERMMKNIQVLISLFNALINSGKWQTRNLSSI